MNLDNIICDFIDKYNLSKGQVTAEIEKTFSSMLSRWHHRNVVVIYTTEGTFEAVAYHDTFNGPEQIPIDLTSNMRGWNTIKRILDKNLSKAACLDEVARYKRKEHDLVWGEIITRSETDLSVELQLDFGVTLYAICPLKLIGKHERDYLYQGDRKAFHLRRIDTVLLGDVTRTKITVDRVSKTLVETLLVSDLQSCISDIKVVCKRRFVGRKCFVESNRFIPKKTILHAAKELGEHIQVTVKQNKQNRNYVEDKREKAFR